MIVKIKMYSKVVHTTIASDEETAKKVVSVLATTFGPRAEAYIGDKDVTHLYMQSLRSA